MTGWCPVHDRVVDGGRGGRCPECGTALLTVHQETKASRMEWVPTAIDETAIEPGEVIANAGRRRVVVFSAAALALAVVAGIFVGRTTVGDRPGPAASASPSVRAVKRELGPFPVVSNNGVALRLLSLSQDGADVRVIFEPGRGRNVLAVRDVSMQIEAGATRADSGAQFDGTYLGGSTTLPSPSIPISRVTVSQVSVVRPGSDVWDITLGPALRATASNEPRVQRVGTARRTPDGPVTLTALLAWRDRVELHFDVSRLEAPLGQVFVDTIGVTGHGRHGEGDSVVNATGLGGVAENDFTVVLDRSVLEENASISVQVATIVEQLNGDWSWTIPPRQARR